MKRKSICSILSLSLCVSLGVSPTMQTVAANTNNSSVQEVATSDTSEKVTDLMDLCAQDKYKMLSKKEKHLSKKSLRATIEDYKQEKNRNKKENYFC